MRRALILLTRLLIVFNVKKAIKRKFRRMCCYDKVANK